MTSNNESNDIKCIIFQSQINNTVIDEQGRIEKEHLEFILSFGRKLDMPVCSWHRCFASGCWFILPAIRETKLDILVRCVRLVCIYLLRRSYAPYLLLARKSRLVEWVAYESVSRSVSAVYRLTLFSLVTRDSLTNDKSNRKRDRGAATFMSAIKIRSNFEHRHVQGYG